MMKRNRILALCLGLFLLLTPLSISAEAASGQTDTQAQSVAQADGLPLPDVYMLGEPLFVALADGSEPAYWQYDIAEIGSSEVYEADRAYDATTANDAGAAAVRALKCWRFDADQMLTLRIAALNERKRVIHEVTLPLNMGSALILQQNGLPVPASITHGDSLVLMVSNSTPVARWQYDLRTADNASIATTTTASSDVSKALSGCLKSALLWGDVDLTGDLHMTVTGLDASGSAITNQVVLGVTLKSTAIIADQGQAIPTSLTTEKLTAKTPALTLRTVSGGEAVWTLRAYDAKGNLIGEDADAAASVSKPVAYTGFSMEDGAKARSIDRIEVTATESGEPCEPVVIRIGTYCPFCGEATRTEDAHLVKNCGHYRCDGHDHYQADCKTDGHCRAYYMKHTRKCASCRILLCNPEGYNPKNCYDCETCGLSMCVSADLDHTVCEGCGTCMWQTRSGEHTQCPSCGLYFCTDAGKVADHSLMRCGKHTACNPMGLKHYKAPCGKDGHYTCDGEHDQCSGCKLYVCDEGYGELNHERCDCCGMRKCDPRYIEAAHLTCAHCGGRLCEPGTEHTLHTCGVEGHYRCDGRWHNSEIISKYCEAEHQHRKCEGDPQHYCDPEDGGCGKYYSCKWSNVHTRCRMCGLRWCDRSNGGHQTPCGRLEHRPCQLPGFRYSDHAICRYCGNPRCQGSHAHCGELLPCPSCNEMVVYHDHKRECGHWVCVDGDHSKCKLCDGFFCDGNEHQIDCPNCDGVYCPAAGVHSGGGCRK